MPSTASSLRELHLLHQRAKALRDRLASAPKSLAAKKTAAAARQAKLDEAKKALQDEKLAVKRAEAQVQAHLAKTEDLKVKQMAIKKNDEFRAVQSQIEANKLNIEKAEGQVIEAMDRVTEKEGGVAAAAAEVQQFNGEVDALAKQIEATAAGQRTQLAELDAAITEAESCIDEDQRDRYRRVVKQRGADALAPVEGSACGGCYVTVTGQMMNDLINGHTIQFCMTCGRMLYLVEEDGPVVHRS